MKTKSGCQCELEGRTLDCGRCTEPYIPSQSYQPPPFWNIYTVGFLVAVAVIILTSVITAYIDDIEMVLHKAGEKGKTWHKKTKFHIPYPFKIAFLAGMSYILWWAVLNIHRLVS